jgi:hypothetical protein
MQPSDKNYVDFQHMYEAQRRHINMLTERMLKADALVLQVQADNAELRNQLSELVAQTNKVEADGSRTSAES